ncbi:Lysyl transferase [Salinisphaera sp. T31B1]
MSLLRRAAPLVLLAIVAAVLIVDARHVDLREIQRALASVPPVQLLGLAVGGMVAVAAMSGYDMLASAVLGLRRRATASLRTALVASGISNIAGLSGVTGSGLRVLMLVRGGTDTREAVRYAGLVTLSGPLGLATLCLAILVVRPDLTQVGALPAWLITLVLVAVACYLPVYALLTGTKYLRRGRLAALPGLSPRYIAAFLSASLVEWLMAGLLLWACLAAVGISLAPTVVLGAFALAAAVGVASFLPGGLGVFDIALASLLVAQGADANQSIAAIVVFRCSYYLVPLLLAILLGLDLLRSSRLATTIRAHPVVDLLQWPLARIGELGIRVLAGLTGLAGIVLLGGAAFPNLIERTRVLRDWVPLAAVEASHLASVAVGLTLIAAARGLSLRLRRALWLAIALLLAGAAAGLLRGLDWGTSLLLIAIAVLLFAARGAFDQQGSLGRQLGAWQWTAALVVALLIYLLLGQALYGGQGWAVLSFAFGQHDARFARGALVAVISLIVLVVWTWPRWPRPAFELPDSARLDRLGQWLEAHGSNGYSHLLMIGDKALFHTADEQALIGYAPVRDRLVALGDPVGEPEALRRAVTEFRRFAEAAHCTPVFYQVEPAHLSLYLDSGFSLFKLGEIARVDLRQFSMTGKANQDKRGAINRAARLGLTFELLEPPFDTATLTALQRVSDDWLGDRPAEKRFSLGRFDAAYLQRAPVAVVHDTHGELKAFASILPSYGHRQEYSIDLMRHTIDAPGGTMDFLFVSLMQKAAAEGYEWFSLGMAPLAGVGDTPWANTAEQIARLAFEHGNRLYNYKGLRAFKDKWNPEWQSMYLAYPPQANLARIQLDIAALIAGGYRRIVSPG